MFFYKKEILATLLGLTVILLINLLTINRMASSISHSYPKAADTYMDYQNIEHTKLFNSVCKIENKIVISRQDKFTLPIKYAEIKQDFIILDGGTNGLVFPWKFITSYQDNIWMTFLIKTGANNFERRKVIRQTWGSVEQIKGKTINHLFLIGVVSETPNIQKKIIEENNIYGDLLQFDFEENYKTLPHKVLGAFKWLTKFAVSHKPQKVESRFYSITDDDCVINLNRLSSEFRRIEKVDDRQVVYCGYKYDTSAKPHRERTSKWYIPKALYSNQVFPPFCHGAFWTLSFPILQSISCISQITNKSTFFLEDVLITGILREKLQLGNNTIKPVFKDVNVEKRHPFLFHAGGEGYTQDKIISLMKSKWKSLS